ncbi:MAG: GNAT family N-acetyltransferase [Phototrophicaceae bacterium]
MSPITIRTLHTADEMDTAVALQKVYWGDNMADLVPAHMLLSMARYGGHIHAAYDGDNMVGMLMGFLGADIRPDDAHDATSQLYVMSKRMVVLPEYRGQKIGEHLKQAQHQFAQQHNIQLVLWTFDPLLSRNAYLNLHKLGAVGQKYEENYFGTDATNPVLSADRLQVNWWVNHPSLTQRQHLNIAELPIINPVSLSDEGLLVPHDLQIPSDDAIRLEIPMEFVPLERINPALGQQWRDTVRKAFTHLLANGYLATDFTRIENRVFYIFTRDDGSYSFA